MITDAQYEFLRAETEHIKATWDYVSSHQPNYEQATRDNWRLKYESFTAMMALVSQARSELIP